MTGGARRIGVIGNPRSHAYRAGPWNARAAHPGLAVAEPDGMPALRDALSRFAAESIDLLIVQGGDGTLRDVLSLLPDAYPDRPPELAILATGNTNLAARIFGRVGSGPRGLDRFVAAAQAGRLCRSTCRTLRVAWRGAPDRPPLRGLFLGAGIYADGKRIADAEIHRRGVHYGPAVGLAAAPAPPRRLAATLLAMLLRRHGGAGPGHHGGLASEIRLCLSGPFVLDGEFFDPGPGGVVLSDGGAVTIVRP
jgi:hypothetical protein